MTTIHGHRLSSLKIRYLKLSHERLNISRTFEKAWVGRWEPSRVPGQFGEGLTDNVTTDRSD